MRSCCLWAVNVSFNGTAFHFWFTVRFVLFVVNSFHCRLDGVLCPHSDMCLLWPHFMFELPFHPHVSATIQVTSRPVDSATYTALHPKRR